MIRRIGLLLFCVTGASLALADQQKATLLNDAVSCTLQALACWKQEVQEDLVLITLLDQVDIKVTDPNTTQLEIGLYGLLLQRIRLLPIETQKIILNDLLSKTTDELIKEAAVLVQVFRSSQQEDSNQQ